ncbi:TenA family protein [Aureimonas psammosilenae]|uniref:TenA family protein n=1 Tax=Aureimonas psammosilenae TaxID=2495496 RepID=UPI0012604EEA|nr:TenA family protein [Aureimonas psammosilenae]
MPDSFSERLRSENEQTWTKAVSHRFVTEIFDGTVSAEVMGSYLVQDHRFLDSFLTLLGAAIASSDSFPARLRLGRFVGMVSGEENTYFLRAFEKLGISEDERRAIPDTAPTSGFKAIMFEASETRSYAAALAVLNVAEWLYLDWASRAPSPLPADFVHAEWITLHDNPDFRDFVAFLRSELDRVGPAEQETARDFFSRAVDLELAFFEAAYAPANHQGA